MDAQRPCLLLFLVGPGERRLIQRRAELGRGENAGKKTRRLQVDVTPRDPRRLAPIALVHHDRPLVLAQVQQAETESVRAGEERRLAGSYPTYRPSFQFSAKG